MEDSDTQVVHLELKKGDFHFRASGREEWVEQQLQRVLDDVLPRLESPTAAAASPASAASTPACDRSLPASSEPPATDTFADWVNGTNGSSYSDRLLLGALWLSDREQLASWTVKDLQGLFERQGLKYGTNPHNLLNKMLARGLFIKTRAWQLTDKGREAARRLLEVSAFARSA